MSHEIRTPMNAILGFADLLLSTTQDPECTDAIATISRNGQFLLQIINDILDLSKIECGRLEVERIDCSPKQVLSDVENLMRMKAEEKWIPLELTSTGPIPETIRSDPLRLRQILINLVGNAIKFTDDGKVVVSIKLADAHCENPQMEFVVSDTGIGIDKVQIANLFQPFTQADTSTTRQYGGTGLGLTICKRLSELLGGTIKVESVPSQGSTFTVSVPTGPLDGIPMTEGFGRCLLPVRKNAADKREPRLLGRRILVAEDGPDNQRLISFILQKAGANLTIAENGLQALEHVLATLPEPETHNPDSQPAEPFDLIVMDMQMPVMDGYAATQRIREAGFGGPILALTAYAMTSDREKCLQAGCDDFATKPIKREDLVDRIATAICPGEKEYVYRAAEG